MAPNVYVGRWGGGHWSFAGPVSSDRVNCGQGPGFGESLEAGRPGRRPAELRVWEPRAAEQGLGAPTPGVKERK